MVSSIPKYLEQHAEPEARVVRSNQVFGAAVAVPLCGESVLVEDLLNSLQTAAQTSQLQVLAVLVVNSTSQTLPSYRAENDLLLEKLGLEKRRATGEPAWIPYGQNLTLLVYDRHSPIWQFPKEQGVGLARKLSCDVVLSLIHRGFASAKRIWTTDGDARVSADYFSGENNEGLGTLVYPYRHLVLPENETPLLLYEIWLRYYVLGLSYAKSPYAFSTLGSTLAISAESYARVRGFPKLLAAEDFYIMNKLAKVGEISYPKRLPIFLVGRPSLRVPFGTGAGMAQISAVLKNQGTFSLYSPRSFSFLKILLSQARSFSLHSDPAKFQISLREDLEKEWDDSIAQAGWELIRQRKIPEILETAARTRKDPAQRLRHFSESFDAFQTLKLVHALRDSLFPNLPWSEALSNATFLEGLPPEESSPTQILKNLIEKEENKGPISRQDFGEPTSPLPPCFAGRGSLPFRPEFSNRNPD